jgi:hypothetical protein
VTVSSRATRFAGPIGLSLVIYSAAGLLFAEDSALNVRATVVGAAAPSPLTIELMRWSTDMERAPLLAALAAPVAPPPTAPAGAAAGRGGRGARGGGRGAAPAPLTPAARLNAAIKAAPTVGFIWGDGPTGYSIKYAWRAASPAGADRIVLITDRRVAALGPSAPTPDDTERDFTTIEMNLDGTGSGNAKAAHANVVIDTAAKTLALDGSAAAPTLLKVTR